MVGGDLKIDNNCVHNPPKSLLKTGKKGLHVDQAISALQDSKRFRFTLVRDPIYRAASAFADKVAKPERPKNLLMKYLNRPIDDQITFSQFLDIIAHDRGALDLDRHWRPQRKEISYDQISFDYIGDVANIHDDLNFINNNIFDVPVPIQDTRKSFGHKSNSTELVKAMNRVDLTNIETAFSMDFEMYEEVRKRFEKE